MEINITHIDTACILLDINGYKILTDPTLDPAGKLYYHGSGTFSRKTDDPALTPGQLQDQHIDLILLSHHQHKDNFDINGQKFAATIPLVLSTKPAAKADKGHNRSSRLGKLQNQHTQSSRIKDHRNTGTASPGMVPEFLAGKVIGFIIEFDGQKNGAIYISGDTVYFSGIREIASKFKIDIGIFHLGSVEFRYLTGWGRYTMNSADLFKSVEVLNPRIIVPIHYRGWTHFKRKRTGAERKNRRK